MDRFHLSIVTAKGTVYDGQVESIVMTGTDGEFGVLAHHTPLIAALDQGITRIIGDEGERIFVTGSGYVDVANNAVSVIVGEAAGVGSRAEAEAALKSGKPWDILSDSIY